MKVLLLVSVGILLCAHAIAFAQDYTGDNPLGMRMYTQKLTVTYSSAEAADMAVVSILPLADGKRVAISGRWDDRHENHPRLLELMAKYGFKGTFYLHSGRNAKGRLASEAYTRSLTEKGFSLGGHTMTHPHLPEVSRSRIWWEVMAIRTELESVADRPVNSFAFSYGQFMDKEDPSCHVDVAASLFRAGYHHNTYANFIDSQAGVEQRAVSSCWTIRGVQQRVKPGVMAETIAIFDKAADRSDYRPNYTLGVHTWQNGKDWDVLEEELKSWANKPDFWYCNQNEYSAYRYQFHHTKIRKVKQEGTRVVFEITRPHPADLGDLIYLTLSAPRAVNAKAGNTQDMRFGKGVADGMFNLPHSDDMALPERIDCISNPENKDLIALGKAEAKDLPGVQAVLRYDAEQRLLLLTLKNVSTKEIVIERSRMRLPLFFVRGEIEMKVDNVAPGGTYIRRIALPSRRSAECYYSSKQYIVAEIDFRSGNQQFRLYCTLMAKMPKE